jgi:hypothetical protein
MSRKGGPIETRKLELSPTFQFDSANTEGAVEVCGETPPAEDNKGKREKGQETGCDSRDPGEYSPWPVLKRPQVAGFKVTAEVCTRTARDATLYGALVSR